MLSGTSARRGELRESAAPLRRIAIFASRRQNPWPPDLHDLRHPQSLLAYEMNREPLSIQHGSPLRLRVENQLGFKQVKWIKEIEFARDFRQIGAGMGGYNEDHEFYGYRDEI